MIQGNCLVNNGEYYIEGGILYWEKKLSLINNYAPIFK